ncbi:MAG: tetratricopeptide repeat protein [Pseudomonadota bacterium]
MMSWRRKLRDFSLHCGALLCLILLAGCDGFPAVQTSSAPSVPGGVDNYTLARAAAEDGNFDVAIVNYERVLAEYPRGKDGAEVRLEYATVLLYADRTNRAVEVLDEATALSRNKDVRGQAAVLRAVVAHSEVEAFLKTNQTYETGRDRAREVYQLMVDTYGQYLQYDVDGVIPARLRVLRESLAKLELRQMRTERSRGDRATASQRAQYIQLEFGDTQIVQENAQLLQTTALRG